MAIDRIGGKGPVAPPVEGGSEGVGAVGKPAAPFALHPTGAAADSTLAPASNTGAVEGARNTALERLRAGEIDTSTYVEIKVDEATRQLEGLPKDQLETIRSELRHRMAADPALADLVQQATGTRLSVPEE